MGNVKNVIRNKFKVLTDEDIEKLGAIAVYKKITKKQLLISACDSAPPVIFVVSGMIRGYLIDEAGNDRTVFLTHENLFAGDPALLFGGKKSKYNFEAEVDSEILFFNTNKLLELGFLNPNISRMIVNSLFEIIRILIERVESMIENLPEERYDILVEQQPALFQTALDKHVANYLGISPVSFSRIKRRKIYK